MKEALLYKKLKNKTAQCQTCAHYCVLRSGQRGLCGVRENVAGKIYSLVYGVAVAHLVDPIEKKPLFHFLPGTQTYSLAAVGCNLTCKNCQNYGISQGCKNPGLSREQIASLGSKMSPRDLVAEALSLKCPSISYTYTEPTVYLEYALDTMRLAKKNELKNVWISNGFLSKESRRKIKNFVDAADIDIKSMDDDFYKEICGARLKPVLETCQELKNWGVWLEITTLVIPGLSDGPENLKRVAHFIAEKLGPETPWHVSQFSPEISWQLHGIKRTPEAKLRQAYDIGKHAGLMHVYTGNIPGLPTEDTYCPKCKTKNIDRRGFKSHRLDKNGYCRRCGYDLNIIE